MSGRPAGGVGSLFLIDANNFLYRAYHALPMLTAPDGRPVNAVHGYVRMVAALRREFAPQFLLAVFDAAGSKAWRRKLYPPYKATRPPAPEDLQPQIPLVRLATAAMSIPWVEDELYEADDLIAAYAKAGLAKGLEVVIVSSDKDLMQLVRDDGGERGKTIRLWDTMKNRQLGPDEVREKFGVGPEQLGDLLALAGDASDNIPGVPGIGAKTAQGQLEQFGDLENLLTRTAEIKQVKRRETIEKHAQDARISRKLVALFTDFELPRTVESLEDKGPERDKLEAFFDPLGFKSTLTGAVGMRGGGGGTRRVAPQTLSDAMPKLPGIEVDKATTQIIQATHETELAEFLQAAKQTGQLAFELHLSGDDPLRADAIGLALAIPDPSAPGKLSRAPVYLPIAHRSLSDMGTKQWPLARLLEQAGPVLRDQGLRKYTHALKDQEVVLLGQGLALAGVAVDTMIASYTLDPARADHDLEGLAKDLGERELSARESVVGKGAKRVGFDQVDVSIAGPWAGERVGMIANLAPHLYGAVVAAGEQSVKLYDEIELPLTIVLAQIERRGIMLDVAELGRQAGELGLQIEELRKQIESEAGYAIDPNSPKQLGKLLFEDRGLPAKKTTKTGYSTDAQSLEELALLDPIVKFILDCRAASPTCRTSRSAPSKVGASARASSPHRASCSSRSTTRRSSCACSRTSRRIQT
jgi:DNA polymerase-1